MRSALAAVAALSIVVAAPPLAAQQVIAVGMRARVTPLATSQPTALRTGAESVVRGRVTRMDGDSIWLAQPGDDPVVAVAWSDSRQVELATRRWGLGALIGAGVGAAVGGVAVVQCLMSERCDGIAMVAPLAFAVPGTFLGFIFAPTRWTTLPKEQWRR